MTDYRTLSEQEMLIVGEEVLKEIPKGEIINAKNGQRWTEPAYTLNMIRAGHYCAVCWRSLRCSRGHRKDAETITSFST